MNSKNNLDPAAFAVSQDYKERISAEMPSKIEIRQPRKAEYFRVHPDDRSPALGIVVSDKETYVVDPDIVAAIEDDVKIVELCVAINREGEHFLLPVPFDTSNQWNASARQVADKAKTSWVRRDAKHAQGQYVATTALGDLEEPQWGEQSFGDLFASAVSGRHIDSIDHPVVKRLRGM
jgi:hypothetical protein